MCYSLTQSVKLKNNAQTKQKIIINPQSCFCNVKCCSLQQLKNRKVGRYNKTSYWLDKDDDDNS